MSPRGQLGYPNRGKPIGTCLRTPSGRNHQAGKVGGSVRDAGVNQPGFTGGWGSLSRTVPVEPSFLQYAASNSDGGTWPIRGRRIRDPACCRPLQADDDPSEWRGSRREHPVIGVRLVSRGHGDQCRFFEGPAHELETNREAIRGEPSGDCYGGKATIGG